MKKLTVLVLGVFLVISTFAFSGCAKKAAAPAKPAKPAAVKKAAKPAKKTAAKTAKAKS